jgi:ABC-2 type transport system ATP-binding protein
MDIAENVVEVADVRRRYGDGDARGFEAVRGVSFQVARGEVFALLGPNGAGKTSTVEMLEGLARPSGGSVRVLGFDPFVERARVRPLTGVMLQESGFAAGLTAAETVRMWAGCVSGARPVDQALELVGLGGRAGVRTSQLSGGERRRLDLALAVLGRPRVLFLDEPTTGLDAQGRRDTWELVRQVTSTGTAVVLTTHYLEEAEALADRLAVLRDGQIVAAGTPAEVTGVRPSRISFALPHDLSAEDLPSLDVLKVLRSEVRGPRLVLHTERLQESLTELLGWAQHRNVALDQLDARTASLEEAYLAITEGGRA